MKILQVTNFFPPSWESGGPARVAYEISKNLILEGHDVTVVTTDGFKVRQNVTKNKLTFFENIPVYYFSNISLLLAKRVVPTPLLLPFMLNKEIKKYNLIHFHEISLLTIIVYFYAVYYDIPYVIQPHGSIPFLINKKSIVCKFLWRIIKEKILRNSSQIIALTKTEVNHIKNFVRNENQFVIIPNGIDISLKNNLPHGKKFRCQYKIKDDIKIILYVGRISNTKGLDLLIKSFYSITTKYEGIILILIGPDDNYQVNIEQMAFEYDILNKIIFTGFLTSNEKYSALVDADVFVTPKYSGFPVTFLESLICGCPIVTTTNGDEIDLLNCDTSIISDYNAYELEKSIISALYSNFLKIKTNKELIGKILLEYDWRYITKRLIIVYEKNAGG